MTTNRPAELIFDQLDTPSLIIDAACVVIEANVAAVTLLGVGRDDLVGARLADFWRTHDHSRLHRAAESLRQSLGERVTLDRVRMMTAGQDSFTVSIAMTGLEAVEGARVLCEILPAARA